MTFTIFEPNRQKSTNYILVSSMKQLRVLGKTYFIFSKTDMIWLKWAEPPDITQLWAWAVTTDRLLALTVSLHCTVAMGWVLGKIKISFSIIFLISNLYINLTFVSLQFSNNFGWLKVWLKLTQIDYFHSRYYNTSS